MSGKRRGVSPSTPEPRGDIAAQVRAMRDPAHPKDAVFVARGNEDALPGQLGPRERAVSRPEGTLVTTSPTKAKRFAKGTDDAGMAKMLGYPSTKDRAAADGRGTAIQARDAGGNVVADMIASPGERARAVKAMIKQAPTGGSVVEGSPLVAQARRADLRKRGL